jgi:hypothetical protein
VLAIHRKQETIACAAFGLNHTFIANSVQLLAETADIDVKIVELVFQVVSPNATEQMPARDQFSGMSDQDVKHGRFSRSKIHLVPPKGNPMGYDVHL